MAVSVHIDSSIRRPDVALHETEYPQMEARLAIALVEKWGMVAGINDGEDSQGRAKLRLSTPAEVVARACETAELLMAEMRRRNWFAVAPPWDDVCSQAKAARQRERDELEEERIAGAARRAARSQT